MDKTKNEEDTGPTVLIKAKKPRQFHPVDKGWAWVIMIASFGVHVLSMGYQRSFGVLFVEFQAKYSSSSAMTSAINGAQSFSYCFLTLLVMNYVVGRVSIRTTCFIGCILQAAGVAASSLVPNPIYLIVTQGILFGCGHALLYCPTLLILSQYFDRRRPIATTLASCGASVGGIAFPVITRKLIDTFGLQGSLLLLSGMMLQQLLCVLVYTPPSDYLPLDEAMDIASDDITIDNESHYSSKNMISADSEKLLQSSDSKEHHSLLNNKENPEVNLKQKANFLEFPDRVRDLAFISKSHDHISTQHQGPKLNRILELRTAAKSHQLLPVTSHFHSHHKQYPYNQEEEGSGSQILKAVSRSSIDQINASMPSLLINDVLTLNERYHPHSHNTRILEDHQLLEAGTHRGESTLPARTEDNADIESPGPCPTTKCIKIPEILKLPKFWIMAVFFACGSVGTGLPAVFLPALAKEKGLTDDNAAFLLIVSSGVDMIGRLLPGFILHFNIMRPSTLMIVPLVIGGTALHMTPIFTDFPSLLAFTVVYGIMSSSFWPLQTLIVIEILSLERLASSMGFYAMFIGVAAGASYPVGGALRDATRTYSTTFHYFGSLYFIAAITIISLQFMRKVDESRENSEEDVSDTSDNFLDNIGEGDKETDDIKEENRDSINSQ